MRVRRRCYRYRLFLRLRAVLLDGCLNGLLVGSRVPGHGPDQGGGCTGGEDDGAAAVHLGEVGDIENALFGLLPGAAGSGLSGGNRDVDVAVVPDEVGEGAEEAFF